MRSYDRLMDKYREAALVGSAMNLMNWDLETYMPPQGIALRSSQLNVLQRIRHRMIVSGEVGSLLQESENEADSLDSVQRRNLQLIRRERDIAASVPEDLVAELESQKAIAWGTWAKAKAARSWKMFEPELRKLVDLSIRRAEATMQARDASCVYDAVMDDFERGITHSQVAELLKELRISLMPLVMRYGEASRGIDTSFLSRRVPVGTQRNLVRDAVSLIGYDTISDKARGRIDEAEHPFTEGYYDDVRITVNYHEDDLFDALGGGLHEAGHALYEQNLNHNWMYQPIGKAASTGIHEAMSRFAENTIGLSRSFWTYYMPRFKEITGSTFTDVQIDDLLKAINKIQPSKIRTKADEITYNLHIIVRFEIERDLFAGKLQISELPQVWNDLYDKYLQIQFEHDGEGILQDAHWSVGAFGYWQCFSLGDICRGMFVRKMEEDIGAWCSEVEKGRFDSVMLWLRDRVQRFGSLYNPQELVEKATGTALTAEPFVRYLAEKHVDLWQ